MNIVAMTPWSNTMDLGAAYNDAMSRLREDEWACLLDHDMMPTTRSWHQQLQEAAAFMPDAGAFTAVTNRIAAPWQQVGDRSNFDMRYHDELGHSRLAVRTLLDVTDTRGFGGVLICISKSAWREAGGFVEGAMLCVDHQMHFALRAAGRRVYVIEGLYVFHKRRAFGRDLPKETPRFEKCDCRGPETKPTRRIALPEIVR